MVTDSLADLKRAFYGGGSDVELAAMKAFRDAGVTYNEVLLAGTGVKNNTIAARAATWQTGMSIVVGQLVLNAGVLYAANTQHTARATFDATEAAMFTSIVATGSANFPFNPLGNMGVSKAIAFNGQASEVEGTLDQTTCAITYTGMPAGVYSSVLNSIIGAAGKTATFPSIYGVSGTDPIAWQGGNGPPVFSTVGATEFIIWSLDGVNMRGAHGQQARTILWAPGNDSTLVSAVNSPKFKMFKDWRIIDGSLELVTAGTVQSTIVDIKNNGTSLYANHTGSRPTVAASATTSGAITLPAAADSPLGTPGQFLTFSVLQFGTNAAGVSIAIRILEAV